MLNDFFHTTLLTPTATTQTFCILSMPNHTPHSDAIVLISLSLIPMASPTLDRPPYAFLLWHISSMATCLSNIILCYSLLPTTSVPASAHAISLPSSYIPCQPHPYIVYFLFLYRPTYLLSCAVFHRFISLPLYPPPSSTLISLAYVANYSVSPAYATIAPSSMPSIGSQQFWPNYLVFSYSCATIKAGPPNQHTSC